MEKEQTGKLLAKIVSTIADYGSTDLKKTWKVVSYGFQQNPLCQKCRILPLKGIWKIFSFKYHINKYLDSSRFGDLNHWATSSDL